MNWVFYLFIFSVLIQFVYYIFLYNKAVFYKNIVNKNSHLPPVSIIICAKNEEENLKKFLPFIYKQNYPQFEVVLINDRSTDHTWDVMQDFKEKHPHNTHVVHVDFNDNPKFIGNKKYAITLGIKAAKYSHLLFTDADCKPASDNWIKELASLFNEDKQMVLGIGKYRKKNSFLNKLIRFETSQTSLQYISYALWGKAYMGVGRNLGYTKDLFFANNGFYNHFDILSGDDDLFVNEATNRENTSICLSPESFTLSIPKNRWKDWVYQKRRHITTASHYKFIHRFLLGVYYLSLVVFYLSALFLLINTYKWKWVLGIVLFRYLFVIYIQQKWMKKLNEKGLIFYFFLLEPLLILIQFYIFILNLFQKPKNWTY